MRSLLAALRQQMPPALWSRGVALQRAERVALLPAAPGQADQGEVELEILPMGGGAALQVVLYLDEDDWACDCQRAACEHAAAAAIAYAQSLERPAPGQGEPARAAGEQAGRTRAVSSLRRAAPRAHVAYAFRRVGGQLSLTRLVVCDGHETPLGVAIKVRQKNTDEPPLSVSASDLSVDAALAGRRLPEVLPAQTLLRIVRALIDTPHVSLDGRPIEVAEPQPEEAAHVSRRSGGEWLLILAPDRALKERFANGAALDGNNRLVGLVPLFLGAREAAKLRAGQAFAPASLPTLLDEVLPPLARQLPVRWPPEGPVSRPKLAARLILHVTVSRPALETHSGVALPTLGVVPQIVYGKPPVARIINGEMRLVGTAVPRRDPNEEQRLAVLLARELDMQCGQRTAALGDAGAALLAKVRHFGLRKEAEVDDTGGASLAFRSRRPLQARLGPGPVGGAQAGALGSEEPAIADDLWFECANETPTAKPTRVSAQQLLDAYGRGDMTLALPDGGFAPLPLRFLQAHHTALAAFLAARQNAELYRPGPGRPRELPAWAKAQLGRLCEALAIEPPEPVKLAWRALATDAEVPADEESVATLDAEVRGWLNGAPSIGGTAVAPVPAGVTLRPYQARGVGWLAKRLTAGLGVLLADEMGLGKTLQTLLACPGRTLVIAPSSLLANWAAECARFCPGRPCHIYHGQKRSWPSLGTNDLVITTYGLLRVDLPTLERERWQAVVLDEAQTIKNAQSQAALAAFRLGQSAIGRVALSGTPLENNLGELWSLLNFCNPGLFGQQAAFVDRFNGPPEGTHSSLREALAPLMLRRRKAAVLRSLPAKSEVILRCTLSDEERVLYDALATASRHEAAAALQAGGNMMEALEALLRLRQAACHPALLPGHAAVRSSAKLDALLATLVPATEAGHRALVFSQWTSLLDLVEPALRAAHIDFARLDGSTANRAEVVRTFGDSKGPPVLLVSLKAGGVGLNLTAADHVFLLDPWWNPAAEDQAADRAHRIGQIRKVLVHRMIAADTIDEQLLALQSHKRRLAAHALGDGPAEADSSLHTGEGAEPFGARLGRDELWHLLRGAAPGT